MADPQNQGPGWRERLSVWGQKVGEKVGEVTVKTIEKTKDVTQRTKEKVKERLGKTETAIQMQNKIEQQARDAVTLAQVNDLYRGWFNSLNRKDGPIYLLYESEENAAKDGGSSGEEGEKKDAGDDKSEEKPTVADQAPKTIDIDPSSLLSDDEPKKDSKSDEKPAETPQQPEDKGPSRKLNFKHVFLRSKALEISLQTILSDSALRKQIVQPSTDDRSSPSFYVYSVLQITISCPPDIWAALLRSGTEASLLTEYQINWLSQIFALLMLDWLDEVYHGERKEMAVGDFFT